MSGPEGEMKYEGKPGLPFFKGYLADGGKDDTAVVTDATYGPMYTNWDALEPNDASYEHVVHIYASGAKKGKWNDYPTNSQGVHAYLVEYGGMPGDSNTSINTTITLLDKNTAEKRMPVKRRKTIWTLLRRPIQRSLWPFFKRQQMLPTLSLKMTMLPRKRSKLPARVWRMRLPDW
ncbi:hypothetical protein ACFSQ7_50855 [Paenibacillus rhizoplanae]